jgi:hypothetical protein
MKSLILIILSLLIASCSLNQINVEDEDLFCEEDTDCVFFASDCESCSLELVNRNNQKKYTDKVGKMCENVENQFACDILPKNTKCISNKCVIVE